MSLLSSTNLSLRHNGNLVLEGVNFSIKRGEIVTIVGPNGSGKSSLLRALVGAIKPSEGHITRTPGLKIGYVPQRLQIDTTLPLTVRRFLNLPHRQKPATISEALTRAGVEDLADRQMIVLSGGQFQRVLLARALLNTPDILILDEALKALINPEPPHFIGVSKKSAAPLAVLSLWSATIYMW